MYFWSCRHVPIVLELWQYTDVLWLSIHRHDQPVALASMVCTFQLLYGIAPYWHILHKSRIDWAITISNHSEVAHSMFSLSLFKSFEINVHFHCGWRVRPVLIANRSLSAQVGFTVLRAFTLHASHAIFIANPNVQKFSGLLPDDNAYTWESIIWMLMFRLHHPPSTTTVIAGTPWW